MTETVKRKELSMLVEEGWVYVVYESERERRWIGREGGCIYTPGKSQRGV